MDNKTYQVVMRIQSGYTIQCIYTCAWLEREREMKMNRFIEVQYRMRNKWKMEDQEANQIETKG